LRGLLPALILLATLGCASVQPSAYQKAAARPTPSTLTPNSRWAVVLLDESGQVAATLVLKLSDVPVKTCDSGNYHRAEVVAEHRLTDGITLHDPAYEVTGSAIRIQLSTGMCDDGYAVVAGVTGSSFDGVHMPEVLFVRKSHRGVRRAFGVWIPD